VQAARRRPVSAQLNSLVERVVLRDRVAAAVVALLSWLMAAQVVQAPRAPWQPAADRAAAAMVGHLLRRELLNQ
jgi:hypothetical protein